MVTPDVPGTLRVTPDPRLAHPSRLKEKCREGHLVVKNGIMLHELNSMGSTPPPTGLTLPVWNTGVRLVILYL